ncbi:N-6 DNA methylase [Micromonospora sp. NPDC048887]|uniref:N-6 DNA methylase n=1 Tax=Micromonospora sp. NPDC048887 TaxID=3155614 RepID=UPI0033FCCE51
MGPAQAHLVSRSEIARLAGVERPAVTNWQRRHQDFPKPLPTADGEMFRRDEVAAWLASRQIPTKGLRAGETPGTTYGDRLVATAAGNDSRRASPAAVGSDGRRALNDVVWRLHDLSRTTARDGDYWQVLLALIFVQRFRPDVWQVFAAESDVADTPARLSSSFELSGLPDAARAVRHLTTVTPTAQQTLAGVIGILTEFAGSAAPSRALQDDHVATLFDYAFDRLAEEVRYAFVTPRSLARLIGDLVGPVAGGERCVDPFCRGGELLVELARSAGKLPVAPIKIAGTHPDPRMVELARMNVAMHGFDGSPLELIEQGEPRVRGSADVVVTNPPFGALPNEAAANGPFGSARRKETALLQSAISSLTEDGRGAVVMPQLAAFGKGTADREMRRALVEAGAVAAVVALPAGLFAETTIGVTLWLIRRPRGSATDVLFIDARTAGEAASRGRRTLRPEDIKSIVDEYRRWRSTSPTGVPFEPSAGMSAVVSPALISTRDYSLLPSTYVAAESSQTVGVSWHDLTVVRAELAQLVDRAKAVDSEAHEMLEGLGGG